MGRLVSGRLGVRVPASAPVETEAKRILNRFQAEVDAQQNARTKATLGTAIDAWLRVHDVEENTRQGYEAYARRYIRPALGHVSVGKATGRRAPLATWSPAGWWSSAARLR